MNLKAESVTILNKFGQPTGKWAKAVKSSKALKMSSFDDFNKYFDKKLTAANLERTPKKDCVVKKEDDKFTDIPDLFSNFLS